uniref:Spidroin-1-like n=1 Tax=Castor canadensis TaxID=51338 RepID=A0A8B7TJQ4_CASCN|nr:spidroin-1-like [Castor canadensis]
MHLLTCQSAQGGLGGGPEVRVSDGVGASQGCGAQSSIGGSLRFRTGQRRGQLLLPRAFQLRGSISAGRTDLEEEGCEFPAAASATNTSAAANATAATAAADLTAATAAAASTTSEPGPGRAPSGPSEAQAGAGPAPQRWWRPGLRGDGRGRYNRTGGGGAAARPLSSGGGQWRATSRSRPGLEPQPVEPIAVWAGSGGGGDGGGSGMAGLMGRPAPAPAPVPLSAGTSYLWVPIRTIRMKFAVWTPAGRTDQQQGHRGDGAQPGNFIASFCKVSLSQWLHPEHLASCGSIK